MACLDSEMTGIVIRTRGRFVVVDLGDEVVIEFDAGFDVQGRVPPDTLVDVYGDEMFVAVGLDDGPRVDLETYVFGA